MPSVDSAKAADIFQRQHQRQRVGRDFTLHGSVRHGSAVTSRLDGIDRNGFES